MEPITPGASHATQVNSGAYGSAFYGIDAATATAGGGGAGAYADGEAFDRLANPSALALSGKLIVPYAATLASGEEVIVRGRVQHRADPGDAWEDYDADPALPGNPPDVTIFALDSGAAQEGVAEFNFDFSGAKRYVRARIRPTFTRANTDTFAHGRSVVALGGFDRLPIE